MKHFFNTLDKCKVFLLSFFMAFLCLLPFLLMLKLGLSSVTAFHYLKRHTTDTRSACIAALLYTFSGFQTMNLVFNHFLDVAVFFPLYLVCLEQLAEEGKRLRFALCTALMAVINYYFFFASTSC